MRISENEKVNTEKEISEVDIIVLPVLLIISKGNCWVVVDSGFCWTGIRFEKVSLRLRMFQR